jgi:hypothetical protein
MFQIKSDILIHSDLRKRQHRVITTIIIAIYRLQVMLRNLSLKDDV